MNSPIRRTRNHPATTFAKAPAAALLLLLMAGLCFGQKATDGSTPAGLAPGTPAGSYALSGFDNVNLFNGHMNFRLPLLSVSGRGGAGYQMTLPVEQTWTIFKQTNEITNVVTYHPEPNWWTGYKPGYGPGVIQGRKSGTGSARCNVNTGYKYTKTLTRLTFTAGDGTEYEFRDKAWDGQPLSLSVCTFTGNNRGKVFKTADGSSATFISDADILDTVYAGEDAVTFSPSGYLLLRDGARYRIDGGTVTWMRDRNGNKLSFVYDSFKRVTSITDSLGRQITVSYRTQTPGSDVITYKGFGAVDRTFSVNYDFMQNALRPDQVLQTPKQLFPDTNGSSTTNYNPTVIKSVTLPNDGANVKQYQLSYNSYGEVARAVLPTGAAIEYDYAAGLTDMAASGSFGGGPQGKHVYRRVVERRVYPAGGSGSGYESKMTYSRPETTTTNAGYVITDTCTPSGTTGECGGSPALLGRQYHYFHGSARSSFYQNAVSYGTWKDGREYQTDVYDTNGTTLLRRVVNTFAQRASVSWWTGQYQTSENAPPNDPRLVETVTTLADSNQVTKQTFGYSQDLHNNQTDVYEYDYGAGAAPTYPARHTHTDYLITNTVNGQTYSYADPANGTTYAVTDIHIRSLPRAHQTYSVDPNTGTETLAAKSETLYDEAAYLMPNYSPAPAEWDSTVPVARGNATTNRRWLDASNSWLETHAAYDQVGNVCKTWDARAGVPEAERVTQIYYADSFSDGVNRNTYAFATQTTSPVPDPANVRATNQPLATSTVYDYRSGLPYSTTNANGKVTSFQHYDPFNRLTRVDQPDGGWTVFWYDRNVYGDYVGTRTAINASQNTEGYQFYDGMGRVVRTFQYEGSQWLTSDTQYDALGRAWRVSANPYLSGGSGTAINPSGHWVETAFDALGRATNVKTTADGAQVATAYFGNSATVTDQAGKKRKSTTDALDRLTQVVEAPEVASCAASGAGCTTTYKYDALGNLRKVEQGGQSRFFMYDSLGRLIRVKYPEQGSFPSDVNFPALTDSVTGNSQWSMGYTYDANGNLHKRKDARNVVTTHQYDNLNRLKQTDYSDGTPMTLRTYDFATDGRGLFYADYESSTQGTLNSVTAYDAAGRPTSRRTDFYLSGTGWVGGYTTSRAYDMTGNVTSQTYPSGRTVTNTSFDAAGRLKAVTGNLGDGAVRTYSDGITYDEAGRVKEERFGTQTPLYHKLHYNVRGQLYDVRLSTAAWATDQWNWNRGALVSFYSNQGGWVPGGSGADNNGNVRLAQHWVPADDGISSYSWMNQYYDYDALNRLSYVKEQQNGAAYTGEQHYTYDRWGNREINAGATYGGGIPEPQFEMGEAASKNRLLAPGDLARAENQRLMRYDGAGNLTHDEHTGWGGRSYDAENRMTSAWGYSTLAGGPFQNHYVYDAAGKRVRRQTDTGEVWQVYGFDGELLAEYAQNGAPSSPKKEYGYRGGELLITAEAGGPQPVSWQSAVGVSVSGNGLTKTGAAGWDAGASSSQTISSGDGYVEFTAAETNTYRFCGLSNGDAGQHYADIDFALEPADDGRVYVWEGGVYRGVWVSYAGGDRFRVAVEGGLVKYYKISGGVTTHLYTSNVAPSYPLSADTSLFNTGATIANVVISAGGQGQGADVRWLVSDHLGTPRMTVDRTGSLAGIKRHDYLAFGEELTAGTGGRTAAQGYAVDNVRQQFTGYERDKETALDFAQARYYAHGQGRFTGVDPLQASASIFDPQSFNRYTYAANNPLRYTDPSGMAIVQKSSLDGLFSDDPKAEMRGQQRQQQQSTPPAQPQVLDVRRDPIINERVEQIRANGTPLAEGETPVLTAVEVVVGQNSVVNNATVVDAYGRQMTDFSGIVRPVAYVPLDQGCNIIDNGTTAVTEVVRVTMGEQPFTSGVAPAPKGGVFIDMQTLPRGTSEVRLDQRVFVGQWPDNSLKGPANGALTVGVNKVVKDPATKTITVEPGKAERARVR